MRVWWSHVRDMTDFTADPTICCRRLAVPTTVEFIHVSTMGQHTYAARPTTLNKNGIPITTNICIHTARTLSLSLSCMHAVLSLAEWYLSDSMGINKVDGTLPISVPARR